ncbi:hypothetical protein WCN91_12485 [Pseudoalteromonas sp. YIC-827]|uniref:Uncharacterized protein n=1 Tax=Pseudoalteromonas qingdaonensis TaxID=3131913 RepID=A0ABU9N1P6_9GAMM
MKFFMALITSITFFSSATEASQCYPRCWAGESQHIYSGEPTKESGSVVNKAYRYNLEQYLSPGADNAFGNDQHLYKIKEIMLYNRDLADIISRSYNYLWPQININQYNYTAYD